MWLRFAFSEIVVCPAAFFGSWCPRPWPHAFNQRPVLEIMANGEARKQNANAATIGLLSASPLSSFVSTVSSSRVTFLTETVCRLSSVMNWNSMVRYSLSFLLVVWSVNSLVINLVNKCVCIFAITRSTLNKVSCNLCRVPNLDYLNKSRFTSAKLYKDFQQPKGKKNDK